MQLDGLRVLLLPQANRQHLLRALLVEARRKYGWRVGILGAAPQPGGLSTLLDSPTDYFPAPDVSIPAAWESDPQEASRIRDLVSQCERHSRLPIHRVVLAGERIIGRAYGREFYFFQSRGYWRKIIADNQEPARAAERLVAFADSIVASFKPDIVVAGTFGSPEQLTIQMVCSLRGIPCFASRSSQLWPGRSFWTTDRNLHNISAIELGDRKIESGAVASERASAFLTGFRDRPMVAPPTQKNWDTSQSFATIHRNAAYRLVEVLRHRLRGRKTTRPKPVFSYLWDRYRSAALYARHRRYLSAPAEQDLAATRYIYIGLHKEPELLLNIRHPEWHSQKNLVALLSANLPAGYRLIVRDHRLNFGRRPSSFYEHVSAYPGVTLVDPFDSQFKYIQNAVLIVTDSGTTGWEGLVFGRKVLTLGRSFYSSAGLTQIVRSPADLGGAILDALTQRGPLDPAERERRLGCIVDSEFETTIEDNDVTAVLHDLCTKFSVARQPQVVAANIDGQKACLPG